MKIAFNPSTVAALITPPNNKDITFDLRGRNIFARGVKFCGTDTWRDIKINNVSIGSNILDLRNGSNTTLTNTNGVVTINSTWRPVVDNLTSDSTTSSLSANQGRVLKSLIDGKSNSGHTHDDRYLKLTGGTMTGNIILSRSTAIIKSLASTSHYSSIVSWSVDGETEKYGREIGLHNTGGDSTGSIAIIPYKTDTEPWSGNVGLFIAKNTLKLDGKPIALKNDIPTSLKNPYSLTLQANGTTLATYDGSVSKIVNLTYDNVGAAAKNHTHNSLEPWASYSYITGDSHATALKSIFDKNKTSIPRNKFISMLSHAYDNTSYYMGYFIKNYDNNPYGGFFVAHYDTAYYIGIANGSFTQHRLVYSTDIPNSLKNPHALTISLNGTSQGPYDGSAAKSINITPSSIGAATSEHNHDNRYLKLTGGTMQLGEGLKFHADENYFGTNSDARIISLLDGNDKVCDGGLIIDERGILDGKEYVTELLRIRDSEFKWRGNNILHGGNYSGILDSRYYTESEVNNLLSKKLNTSDFNWTNLPGKVVLGNEFNIVNAGFKEGMWFNYLPINDRSKTATITGYHFGNGATGYTSIKASGFIKNGSSSSYVLLGDGGHQTISSLSVNHALFADYICSGTLPTPANNTVKAYKDSLAKFFNDIRPNGGVGANVNVSESIISNWSNDSATYHDSSTYCFIKIGGAYAGATYGQFLLSSYNLSKVGIVGRTYSQWSKIKWLAYEDQIPTDNNQLANGAGYITSAGSCAYATSAGNADTVDGYHVTSGNNKPWNTIPAINNGGWMDIGKQLEFHFDNTTGSDYSTILRCTGNYSNLVNLPSESGTLALTKDVLTFSNDIADYLDASFNNSDFSKKAASKYIQCYDSAGGWWNWMAGKFMKAGSSDAYVLLGGGSHKLESSLRVAYASNADMVDGYHVDDILPYGLENLCIGASKSGGQTILNSDGSITTSGNDSDTYFHVRSTENLIAGQIYTVGFYVTGVPSGNTATWSFPFAGQSNNKLVINIKSNGWCWGTGTIPEDIVAGKDIMFDDSVRGFYSSINISKFVIVKGKQKAYYTPPISKMSVNYANSAGNADTVDGYHANGLLTALSNSDNGISVTVGGTTKSISNISVNYATSSGNADTLDGEHAKDFVRAGSYENNNLNSLDTYSFIRSVNSQVSSTSPKGNIGWYNVIQLVHRNGDGDGPNYIGQIALGMTTNVNDIFFRCGRTDPWKTIIHSNNYTEFINNYYWANVKISTSSSTTTSPTVSNLTATSSIRMGDIYLQNANEINSTSGIHLNYRNSGNVSLCYGGGKVGIGTPSPAYKLDVVGNIRATGNSYATHFYESSDKTLKKNIKSILSSTNIPKIREFDWKDTEEHSYGFIAQELEEQGYGCLVSEANGKKTVNYTATLALTVAKLQNLINIQNKKISNLTKELKALKYGRKKNS